jgi:hypothetical protein
MMRLSKERKRSLLKEQKKNIEMAVLLTQEGIEEGNDKNGENGAAHEEIHRVLYISAFLLLHSYD